MTSNLVCIIVSENNGLPQPKTPSFLEDFYILNIVSPTATFEDTYRIVLSTIASRQIESPLQTEDYLVVRNTCTSLLDKRSLESKIRGIPADCDICYLSSYGDDCTSYRDYSNGTYKTKRSGGDQAIFFRKSSLRVLEKSLKIQNVLEKSTHEREKRKSSPDRTLLENLVSSGKLTARVFVPNIISFDITQSRSIKDEVKLSLCGLPEDQNEFKYYLCVFVVILAAFVIMWRGNIGRISS